MAKAGDDVVTKGFITCIENPDLTAILQSIDSQSNIPEHEQNYYVISKAHVKFK